MTKTCKYDPEYHPYYAPEHDFLEYNPEHPTVIKPTYYKAPEVYGEESYGYVDTPYEKKRSYPVGKKGAYYDDHYAEPMKVRPRYPTEPVQTYNRQVVEKVELQPARYAKKQAKHSLVPAYEKAEYYKPKYGPPRKDYPEYGHEIAETPYAPKSKAYYPEKKYGGAKRAVQTDYYPTYDKAPVDYSVDYACDSCGYY